MTAAVPWRLLETGRSCGAFNLALDDALFHRARKGMCPPTIRFYGWSPPALSVGYFQSWEREIDVEACRQKGVEIYRRITGGRAVLHDREVTYSVVCGESSALFGEGMWPAYRRIGEALAAGLASLGVPVDLVKPSTRREGRPERHPSCFSSSLGYELSSGGKKLAGSAQKKSGEALLQHGSILLGDSEREFSSLLLKERSSRNGGGGSSASLDGLLGGPVVWEEVCAALRRGFEGKWGVSLLPGGLDGEEEMLARRLEKGRYSSWEWNGPKRKNRFLKENTSG